MYRCLTTCEETNTLPNELFRLAFLFILVNPTVYLADPSDKLILSDICHTLLMSEWLFVTASCAEFGKGSIVHVLAGSFKSET